MMVSYSSKVVVDIGGTKKVLIWYGAVGGFVGTYYMVRIWYE